ncbi:MAG: HDOD domain-containing protein [Leptonema sp. (in: Bacteria)]|nr:HDOD domain-containing protein [Leptonema sp. (in: bacteria)]
MVDIQDFQIPPLSTVIMKIMQYDHTSPDASVQDLEKIVEADKGVVAEILRVSNSAFYGRSGKIRSLRDAVTLLGLKALKNLIIFLGTKSLNAAIKDKRVRRYVNELPIVTALLGKDIATDLKKQDLAEEVFLASLLHKIGMSILAMNKADHYAYLVQQVEESGFDLIDMEQRSYQISHDDLGRKLTEQWKLPSELIRCAGIGPETKLTDLKSDMERITYIASIFSMQLLGIPVSPATVSNASVVYEYMGGEGDAAAVYTAGTIFSAIQKHPFYQMAVV